MLKTLIRVGASWCAPCHIFAETFEKASKIEQYKDIDFKSVDIEDDNDSTEELVEKFKIKNVPTTLFLDENGEQIYKLSGNISLDNFIEIIDNAINGNI